MPGDTKNKRSKLEIKQARMKIAKLYIQGKYQSEIAGMMGLTQQQISYDLKVIQKEWLQNTTFALDDYKAKELAKIDLLERTFWDAWERSLEEFRSQVTKAKGSQKGKPNQAERIIKTEDRNGDPRYLDGVMKCIERRAKLLGLDSPEKREHTGKGGGPIVIDDKRSAVRERLKNNPELKEKLKNAFCD